MRCGTALPNPSPIFQIADRRAMDPTQARLAAVPASDRLATLVVERAGPSLNRVRQLARKSEPGLSQSPVHQTHRGKLATTQQRVDLVAMIPLCARASRQLIPA